MFAAMVAVQVQCTSAQCNMIGLDQYTRYELQRQWMQTMDLMSKNNVWRGGGLGLWWGNNSCGKIHVWVTSYDHTWNTLLVLMNGGWLWFCLICPYCLRWICWWCSVDGGDLCSAPLWRGVRRPGGAHIGGADIGAPRWCRHSGGWLLWHKLTTFPNDR